MSLTFADLLERLKHIDEISLLEVLQITSEDLVDRFSDRIEDNFTSLTEELEDEEESK